MTRTATISVLLVSCCALAVAGAQRKNAGNAWPYPDSLDAIIAAPSSHKILFENERVRVLEVVVPAHGREPVHTHRWPSVMHMDVPSKFRYYDSSGKATFEAGEVERSRMTPMTRWFEPEGPHSIENLTDTPFHAIRVELKK